MPIESASIINQLNQTYPAATDGVQEGDDHIRLLKSVIKNTFPNITGQVTASHTALNQIGTNAWITSSMLASGVAAANLGFTPLNKAGDNVTGNLTIGGSQVLHAGNYNSYSPTLTGGNASGTWGINITGRGYPRRSDGNDLNFIWSGQGGQPTYLWGGSDGTNMYVYNPSNFSVNYANSAGSAGSASTANYANSAGSASANVLKTGDTMSGNLTIQNSAPTIVFADTDNVTRQLHCNSNHIGFLNSGGGWAMYSQNDGNLVVAGGTITAGGATVMHTSNYSSWVPARDGTYAYGTWPINITGNSNYSNSSGYANSAGSANYVAWGNVGGRPNPFVSARQEGYDLVLTRVDGSEFRYTGYNPYAGGGGPG